MKEVDGEFGGEKEKNVEILREIDHLFDVGLHMRGMVKYVV
jgi:hypothetical protein